MWARKEVSEKAGKILMFERAPGLQCGHSGHTKRDYREGDENLDQTSTAQSAEV
jgi:hypothetical protein